MRRVTTHIYASKRNTDWKMDLKKNPDTHSLAPYLIRILNILRQTICAFTRPFEV